MISFQITYNSYYTSSGPLLPSMLTCSTLLFRSISKASCEMSVVLNRSKESMSVVDNGEGRDNKMRAMSSATLPIPTIATWRVWSSRYLWWRRRFRDVAAEVVWVVASPPMPPPSSSNGYPLYQPTKSRADTTLAVRDSRSRPSMRSWSRSWEEKP